MIINYDSRPCNSILYTASKLFQFLKTNNNYREAQEYFLRKINKDILCFYLSMDWLFLMGRVSRIEGDIIICI